MANKRKCNIWLISSARPNFVKMAPLYTALAGQDWCSPKFIYIAQHTAKNLTTEISHPLGIDRFDIEIRLEPSEGFARRIGDMAQSFFDEMAKETPDLVVVPGDVDASFAVTLAARRNRVPVAHLEAGLRSYDLEMPEELNRILIDSVSNIWLAPSETAYQHLIQDEARNSSRVHNVGNIMIDSVVKVLDPSWSAEALGLPVNGKDFALVTMHRPHNVDEKDRLEMVVDLIGKVAEEIPVVLPAHPRLHGNLARFEMLDRVQEMKGLHLTQPMGYTDFVNLMAKSAFILTDSGGIQEEAAFLKKRCFTYRKSTERPQTVECGSNTLVNDYDAWEAVSAFMRSNRGTKIREIPLWDGQTRYRIAHVLHNWWFDDAQ